MQITEEQKEELKGFFLYMFSYIHGEEQNHFSWWAQKLDNLKIPWIVQNLIAGAAEDKQNGYIYFSSLLKKLQIEVI